MPDRWQALAARLRGGGHIPLAVGAALGDELAGVLEGEPFGLSASALARRVRRGKPRVLDALHSDSRFMLTGTGRGCRWRVVTSEPQGTGPEARRREAALNLASDLTQAGRGQERASESVRVAGGGGRPTVELGAVMGIAAAPGATAARDGRA